MLKKLLTSAVFAGFGAGLIAAVLQIMLLVPILLEAEEYESGNKTHFAELVQEEIAEADHAHDEPSSFSRNGQTVLWTAGTFFGFALLMVAGFGFAEHFNQSVTARSGIIWGLAGFAALQFLPAAGMPPELPGAWAADLFARQYWWAFTAIVSIMGLAGLAFGKNWATWAIAICMLAVPHIVGAPQPDGFGGVVPPELAAHFASLSLVVGAVSWMIMGLFAGYFWQKSNT